MYTFCTPLAGRKSARIFIAQITRHHVTIRIASGLPQASELYLLFIIGCYDGLFRGGQQMMYDVTRMQMGVDTVERKVACVFIYLVRRQTAPSSTTF